MTETLTPYLSSFFILFREGFEALLISILVFTYLDKMNARHHRPAVMWGLVAGVVVSLLTALAVKKIAAITHAHEELFLGVGADVLEFVGSVLTVHPDNAIRAMKSKLKSVAAQVRNSGSPAQIQKLKTELERLNQLGGIEKIVANEGLVFVYNGKTYKLTGTFAPLNQILGIFYS